jgi:SAM-dependent methyltransferase
MRDFAPAAERNKEPIRQVLDGVLPARGLVLEIASGTGQHVVHFAGCYPALEWQPSDCDGEALASIRAHAAAANLANVRDPIELDVTWATWPVAGPIAAMVCINMIHIAPWTACLGVLSGAARHLPTGGCLLLYGPFREGGRFAAASNAEFDARLRAMDPAWGVRDIDEVSAAADARGLTLEVRIAMPANNLTVVFRRRAGAARAVSDHGADGT